MTSPIPSTPTGAAPQSLSDFWDQRATSEGTALKFPTVGTSYTFMVTRKVTKADVSQQTDVRGELQFDRGGQPKWVLTIPGKLADGTDVSWWCKGQGKTALMAAMQEAGTSDILAGSLIKVTFTRERPTGPGFNPSKIMEVVFKAPAQSAVATPEPIVAPHDGGIPSAHVKPVPVEQPTYTPVVAIASAPVQTPVSSLFDDMLKGL